MKNVYGDKIGLKEVITGLAGAILLGLAFAAIVAPVAFVIRWIF